MSLFKVAISQLLRTFWALQLVYQELDWVLRLVNNESLHHVLKRLVEFLLLDVLFTATLVVQLLLFQHHF